MGRGWLVIPDPGFLADPDLPIKNPCHWFEDGTPT